MLTLQSPQVDFEMTAVDVCGMRQAKCSRTVSIQKRKRMKTFLIGILSLAPSRGIVYEAQYTHNTQGKRKKEKKTQVYGGVFSNIDNCSRTRAYIKKRTTRNYSIGLIDCDGVLSAGFARHLAHRQRHLFKQSIPRSVLCSHLLFHFPFDLFGRKDPTSIQVLPPLWCCHRVCLILFSIPAKPRGKKRDGQSQHRSHDNYQRFYIKIFPFFRRISKRGGL